MIVLGIATLLVLYSAASTTPVTHRLRFIFCSDEILNEQGKQAFMEIQKQYPVIPSYHHRSRLVQRIGTKLAESCGAVHERHEHRLIGPKDYEWEFIVLDTPDIMNAMCLPGGKVVVFSGLLDVINDDAEELAAVLSHEISHALMKHHTERSTAMHVMSAVNLVATWMYRFGMLGTSNDAFLMFGMASVVQSLIFSRYLRRQESEADEVGQLIMSRACYDPRQMITAFARMYGYEQKKLKEEGMDNFAIKTYMKYFGDHPQTEERIKVMSNRQQLEKAETIREKYCMHAPQRQRAQHQGEWYEGLE